MNCTIRQIKALQKEKGELRKQLACLKDIYQRLDSRHKALEDAYDELGVELERAAHKTGTESLSYKLLNAAYNEACTKVKDLTIRNEVQRQNIQSYQEDVKELKSHIAAMKEQLEERDNTIKTMHAVNYELNKQDCDLKNKIAELEHEKKQAQHGYSLAMKYLGAEEAKAERLDGENRDLKIEIAGLKEQVAGIKNNGPHRCGECAHVNFYGDCVLGTCFGFVDKNNPKGGALETMKTVNKYDSQFCPKFRRK